MPKEIAELTDDVLDLEGLEQRAYGTETDIRSFLSDADVLYGRQLVSELDELVGVPLGITGMRFTQGAYDRTFVSVEAVKLREKVDIVFNDGSTGIRRQCVQYLIAKGIITDLKVEEIDDAKILGAFEDIKWACLRGVRKSTYTNEHGPATTFYLA